MQNHHRLTASRRRQFFDRYDNPESHVVRGSPDPALNSTAEVTWSGDHVTTSVLFEVADVNDYSEKLQSLYAGPSGEFVELEIRQFQDDLEAHDPDLQERYSAEMLAEFDSAIRQCTELWGQPENRILWDDPEADTWLERSQVGFIELAYWPRTDGKYLFIAFDHADRECPMLLIAGITL